MLKGVLLFWALDLSKFFQEKYSKENILIVKPEKIFKKTIPPKDDSFPHEKSNIWNSFEDDTKVANESDENIQEDNSLKIKENDKNSELMQKKDEIKVSKTKEDKLIRPKTSTEKEIINNQEENKLITNQVYYYVQIASLSKRELVDKEWARLKKKHFNNMSDLNYIVEEVQLKNNNIFFRLLVGEFVDKKFAKAFCSKIDFVKKCIIKKKSK